MLDGGWMVIKNVWMEAGWWLKCFIKGFKFSCFKHTVTERSGRMAKGLLEQRDIKNN